jgi:hypothetical protein
MPNLVTHQEMRKDKVNTLLNSIDNPPEVDNTIITHVTTIANAICKKKWHDTSISVHTVKLVLQAMKLYSQLVNIEIYKEK